MATKLELTQINARLAEENAALRARTSQLDNDLHRACMDIQALEADVLRITEVASALNAPRPNTSRPAYVMPAWQVRRAEAMAQARALAMSKGVLVAAF